MKDVTYQHVKWGELVTLEYGKRLVDYKESDGEFDVFGTNGPIGKTHNAICNKPTIIIGRKGAYRGVYYSDKPCSVIDTAFYIVPKTEFDMKWAYYALLSQDINSLDSGSAIPSTSRGSFYNLNARVPPLETQKEIAHILGTLDDKIELNRKMNKTLEEIAQTLYKHWFIDFEFPNADGKPYKSSGGEMIDSELGPIPKGWRWEKLTAIARIEYGSNLSKAKLNICGYPVYGGNGIIGYLPTYQFEESQILISCRGAASGKVNITIPKASVTHNSLLIKVKSDYVNYKQFIMRQILDNDFSVYVSGSAQPQITIDNLFGYNLLIPDYTLCCSYGDMQAKLNEKSFSNLDTYDNLTRIKDMLLNRIIQ